MQNPPNFSERLESLLCEKLGIEKDAFNPQANLATDLNLTEVEKADLIAFLEKELNFVIEDKSKITNINTIEDLVRIIEESSNEF